jgi:hypothetical protein
MQKRTCEMGRNDVPVGSRATGTRELGVPPFAEVASGKSGQKGGH